MKYIFLVLQVVSLLMLTAYLTTDVPVLGLLGYVSLFFASVFYLIATIHRKRNESRKSEE